MEGESNGVTLYAHRAAALIDLHIIANNIQEIRRHIGPDTKLMAVVKAAAYGHGAVEIARTALANGVDWFGVATDEEALSLRASGIEAPILLLGYAPPQKMRAVLEAGILMTLFDWETAKLLSDLCLQTGLNASVHLKVDTGMGRIGVLPDAGGLETALAISHLPGISVTGLYTHLAQSDADDKSYAHAQLERFKLFTEQLEEAGLSIPCKHISNSGAIVDLPDFRLDMVRAGIILYGLRPSQEVDGNNMHLEPALSWQSYISYIKTLPPGETISYRRTYTTSRPTVVATVPIGYADGYSWTFSNRGLVLINGQFAPVIGRICMDQFMVDVTDIQGAERGAPVILIGRQGENAITADDLAEWQGTLNYEVICGISKRVERIYR